jgi:hypothetical protein
MNKKAYSCLFALIWIFMLVGCAEFRVETHLNSDGSGFRRVAVAVDEQAYQLIRQQKLDPVARLKTLADQIGARVEPYQSSGRVGVMLAKDFGSLEDLLAWNQTGLGEEIRVSRHDSFFTTEFRYEATLDSSQYDITSLPQGGPQAGKVELRYILELPGTILEHNAIEQTGNRLVWILDPVTRARYNLYAVYRVPNIRNIRIIIGASILVIVILVVLLAFQIRRSIRGY